MDRYSAVVGCEGKGFVRVGLVGLGEKVPSETSKRVP